MPRRRRMPRPSSRRPRRRRRAPTSRAGERGEDALGDAARDDGGGAAGDVVGATSLPASDTVISFAVLGPMPLTLRNTASSSPCTAAATLLRARAPTAAERRLRPDARDADGQFEDVELVAGGEPEEVSASSRTMRLVCTGSPRRAAGEGSAGVVFTWNPTPPTSITTELPEPRREHAAAEELLHPTPPSTRPRNAPRRSMRAGPA